MTPVVLSADGDGQVYLVPDSVAENLTAYCMEFCSEWLWTSPDAEQYRRDGYVCYNEADFIAYLNKWICPEEPSTFVETLRCHDVDRLLYYQNCPHFNF